MTELAHISWVDAKEYFKKNDLVLLPVGSTEQHGPQNPLGTDYLTAEALAVEAGKRTGAYVLPVIPVGVSSHHRQFPGTLWVSPQTLTDYVLEVALAVASHGAKKILIINGHGGNMSALMEVAKTLRMDHGIFAAITSYWFMTPSPFGPGDGHGGAMETGINMYFYPELVKIERAVDTEQKDKLGELPLEEFDSFGVFHFSSDTIDLSDTGVMGAAGTIVYSTTADKEKAKEVVERYLGLLCKDIEQIKKVDVSTLLSKPHK